MSVDIACGGGGLSLGDAFAGAPSPSIARRPARRSVCSASLQKLGHI
jgi:hypothetical protein